ncbi:ankyrin repeat and SOCS box protein 8-like [Lytechinus pictus]|uniref:ankyrin repeat and SOCS box protein 8-like n=1 Tax=Lytechinus pictus TaxID=7653 RepID=UPI0030BA1267
MSMYHCFAMAQHRFTLSDRLIRAISGWTLSPKDSVESVLAEGADVNQLHGTLLPLHCACMTGEDDYVKLLLDHGAEVNAVDGYGRAAIHYAAEQDVDCLSLLLESGADPNALNANGETAIHWASFRNQVECVQALLSKNASINIPDIHGNTPLNWAAMKGNHECVQLLLEYGVETHTSSVDGVSPISRVASLIGAGLDVEEEESCLNLLISATGQFDIRDEDGLIPSAIQNDTALCNMLWQLCSHPRSLRQLCRYTIRHHLNNTHLPTAVKLLPLPARLQRYLLLQT